MARMSAKNADPASRSSNKISPVAILVVVGTAVLLTFAWHSNNPDETKKPFAKTKPSSVVPGVEGKDEHDAAKPSPNVVTNGSINSIAYFHCAAGSDVDPSQVRDIVLLHGSRFTKQDWQTSGILEILCDYDQLSVTALDLSVQSKFDVLGPVLESLKESQLVSKLPISALVTPSASGVSVVSAIQEENVQAVKDSVGLWIPVASGSVLQLSAEQLGQVKEKGLPVWAVHGNQDAMGRQVSAKLEAEAGATVEEFPGGHPFYLQIPLDFSNALVTKLQIPVQT